MFNVTVKLTDDDNDEAAWFHDYVYWDDTSSEPSDSEAFTA